MVHHVSFRVRVAVVATLMIAAATVPSFAAGQTAEYRMRVSVAGPVGYKGAASADAAGVVWSEVVAHPGASQISLRLREFDLAPGDTLRVANLDGSAMTAYTAKGPNGDGDFWTAPLAGDTVLLELVATSKDGGRGFRLPEYRAVVEGVSEVEARRAEVLSVYNETRETELPTEELPGERVIYGADDRLEPFQVSDQFLLDIAQAAVVVVSTSEITNNGNGTYTLITEPWLTQGGTLCADEPFRGQLQIGNCSGYLVGDDILITAGHCITTGSCGSTAFIFGFDQLGPSTPPNTVVPAANVYFCQSLIDRQLSGGFDHAVVRLDRPVVGRQPLEIRRTGSVTNGDPLVMIGHPVVLPKKIAGGAIVRNANGASPFFKANLDAYGGNSGSLVANSVTGVVEGILVRGNPDFTTVGGCVRSAMLPDENGDDYEECSKTTGFAQFVPELVNSAGTIKLDGTAYNCADTLSIEVRDSDLEGNGTATAVLTIALGDVETVTLTESPANSGKFSGTLMTATGAGMIEDGTLNVAHGNTIIATYFDADDGTGSPAVVTDDATVDCVPPAISNVAVTMIGGTRATITFTTNEAATPTVRYGTSCGALGQVQAGGAAGTSHSVMLTGLTPLTAYFFEVEATDVAGNSDTDDNGGSCYTFSTLDQPDYFTEQFASGFDLAGSTLTFIPDGSVSQYRACLETGVAAFPTNPAGGTELVLTDDDNESITPGGTYALYGTTYTSVFVGSNGYVTFGGGSNDYDETLAEHFGLPRVAAAYDDFNPTQGTGSTVSWRATADRVAITWENMPQHNGGDQNNMQIELHTNGTITITWLAMGNVDCIVGLSAGGGQPPDFIASNLGNAGPCSSSAGTIALDRAAYSCEDTVMVEVRDDDLTGVGTLMIELASSSADDEVLTLTETPAASGIFVGSIDTSSEAGADEDGTLQVADGGTISAEYNDADDGTGNPAQVDASAAIDCAPAEVNNVTATAIGGFGATITFTATEPVSATVRYGTSCGSLTASVVVGAVQTSHAVVLAGLTPATTYSYVVEARDAAGNLVVDDNAGACHTFTTTDLPVFFTQLFDTPSPFDLDNSRIVFTPNGSGSFYAACRVSDVTAFETDPAGGTVIPPDDDSSTQVTLTGGATVSLYGTSSASFFVNDNGNITFGTGDTDFSESIAEHFDTPRISAMWDDLNPEQGGTLSWRQLADRVAVTWQGMPQHDVAGDANSFQVELFFDGTIAITHLAISSSDSIVGLSQGQGTPSGFVQSDLSVLSPCMVIPPDDLSDGMVVR